MTLNEILTGKGLTEDAVNAVLEAMKANRIFTAGEENLDIRYGKLKTQHEGTAKALEEANKLIAELKASSAGQETMQQKIADYEKQVQLLTSQLSETKIDAEARKRLMEAGALDADYLLYKMREKARADGKQIELDENGKIKDWDGILSQLQTQAPNQFPASPDDANGDGYQVVQPLRLKVNAGGDVTVTKERFHTMSYEERMALKKTNEKQYNQLAK